MIRVSLWLLVLVLPAQAIALSCVAPSVERSYLRFDASDARYVIVHGRLTLDEGKLPKNRDSVDRLPKRTVVEGKLRGVSLTQTGFKLPFEQDVSLEVSCLSRWCGSARNGEDVLAFVRKDADGYAIELTPCGGAVFGAPRPDMLKSVKRCARGGRCSAD